MDRQRLYRLISTELQLLGLLQLPDIEGYVSCVEQDVEIRQVIETVLGTVILPPPPQIPSFYNVLFEERPRVRRHGAGVDIWTQVEPDPERFFRITGETPESLGRIADDLFPILLSRRRNPRRYRRFRLTVRNRLMMTLMWLRQYPRLDLLATLFNVSKSIISKDLYFIIPVLWRYFHAEIRWPAIEEWLHMQGTWPLMPNAIAAIDGTLTEINIPLVEPQVDFYSGNGRYHCLSTQIVIDCTGQIRYLQSGFLGRENDAMQYHRMPTIGPGQELDFPEGFYVLADKIYPNDMPLVTPFRRNQLNGRADGSLFNRVHGSYRVKIEHTISYLKKFASVKGVYRHQRWFMPVVADVCACFAQRHVFLVRQLR